MEETSDPCYQRIDFDTKIDPNKSVKRMLKLRRATNQIVSYVAVVFGMIMVVALSFKPELTSERAYIFLVSFLFAFAAAGFYDVIATQITLQAVRGRIPYSPWNKWINK
jgi:hypothetical protein